MRLSSGLRNAAAAILLLTSASACLSSGTEPASSPPSNPAADTFAPALGVNLAGMTKLSNDLYIQDLVAGTGTTAATGSQLTVTYSGWLTNGVLFDSNVGQAAFPLTLGVSSLIDGWQIGLVGVKAGGKRRLVIGSNLGYGSQAYGPIPASSTLVFDVVVATVK